MQERKEQLYPVRLKAEIEISIQNARERARRLAVDAAAAVARSEDLVRECKALLDRLAKERRFKPGVD